MVDFDKIVGVCVSGGLRGQSLKKTWEALLGSLPDDLRAFHTLGGRLIVSFEISSRSKAAVRERNLLGGHLATMSLMFFDPVVVHATLKHGLLKSTVGVFRQASTLRWMWQSVGEQAYVYCNKEVVEFMGLRPLGRCWRRTWCD